MNLLLQPLHEVIIVPPYVKYPTYELIIVPHKLLSYTTHESSFQHDMKLENI